MAIINDASALCQTSAPAEAPRVAIKKCPPPKTKELLFKHKVLDGTVI